MKCIDFNKVFDTDGFEDILKKPYNFNDYTFLIQIKDIYNSNLYDIIVSNSIDTIMHYINFHNYNSEIYILNKHNMNMLHII